jgi:hypothetical protein
MAETRKGWIKDGIGYIPLTQEQTAKVDPENVDWLSNWNWSAHWEKNTKSFIAYRGTEKGGRQKAIKMHRFIMGVTDPNIKVDHENHDTMDNRWTNLRKCNNAQNLFNCRKSSNNTSGFKGVSYVPRIKKYRSYITVNQKAKHLGYFDTAEAAFERRKEEAEILHGEFACSGENYATVS